MNLSTVKWAQWDKTQPRDLLVHSYVCALHWAQLLHTILHRTDLIIFPLTLWQSPQLRWCLTPVVNTKNLTKTTANNRKLPKTYRKKRKQLKNCIKFVNINICIHIIFYVTVLSLNSTQINSTSCKGRRCERLSPYLWHYYITTFQLLRSLIYPCPSEHIGLDFFVSCVFSEPRAAGFV